MKQLIKGNVRLLCTTIILSLLANIALVLTSKQYEWLFNVLASGDFAAFTNVILIAIAYIFFVAALFYIYLVCSKKLIQRILKQLREQAFCGIMKKNMKSYYAQNTSEYISVLTNDITLLEENWMKPMLGICESIAMFITTVIMLIYYSPWITLAIFATSALVFTIPSILGKYLAVRQQNLSRELATFTNSIRNIFCGFDVIHAFHMQQQIRQRFRLYNERLSQKKYETDFFKVKNDTIGQVLGITIQIGTSCLSAYLVLTGQISIGALAAVIQLCSRFVMPLMSIMNQMSLIKSMKPILQKLETLQKESAPITEKTPHFNREIAVSGMSFSYDKHPVLKDINLTLFPGKKYAIMGASGCGKTTLMRLLLGYYTDYTGTIQYDGEEVSDLNPFLLNKMVSVIQQNVYLFDDSIRYNICLEQEYSEDCFLQALQRSGTSKIFNRGLGPDSPVGENGCNLSGGQRQRISIARALIRHTPILILDEGTSAVDMQSACEIEADLLSMDDLTLFSILHKTSETLLRQYDAIIYMHNGQIAETGSFTQLMTAKGTFYQFYQHSS